MIKFLMAILMSYALCPLFLYAGSGSTPDFQNHLWKSSETGTGELFNSRFSSGPVVFHKIVIASPTVNSGSASYVRVMSTTSATYDVGASTVAGMNANDVQSKANESSWDVLSSTWSYIDKRGGSTAYILWDWLDSILSNPTNSLQ